MNKRKGKISIIALAVALLFAMALGLTANVAFAAPPVVKTVPWVPTNPLIPHDTYTGKLITLKGTSDVQGAGYTYAWDFGDGSPVATGTVTNRYAVQATHTYTGVSGTIFTARLTVRNTGTGETGSKEYFVEIRDKTLPVEVNIAIDEGLWYLYKIAVRSGTQYYWSNTGGGGGYDGYYANSTSSAVQAFLANGHLENGDQAVNPYVEAVRGGMDFLFTRLYVQAMSNEAYGNPDSNGNGIGISVNSARPIYESGAVMDALIATGTPNETARTGPANILGRVYKDIVQDMIDMHAWGQTDNPGSYGGAWQYSWDSQANDNSASQWGAIGMIPAERNWGLTVPQWVKDRNAVWLNYSYNAGQATFGYTGTGYNRWYTTGPCGMVELSFVGANITDPRWVAVESRIANNWNSFIVVGDARYYAFYAFSKAMRLALPSPVTHLSATGLDWYGDNTVGLARVLVNSQNTSGYWPQDGWPHVGYHTAAAWNIIILGRTLFQAGSPVAVAQVVPNPGVVGQTITLSGSASYHQDASKSIDSWEWDLNNDGVYDVSGPVVTTTFAALSDYPVKLRVTDNATPEQSAETIVTVRITTPPIAPTADADGPYSFCPDRTPWFLDGTGSINPDEGEHEPGMPGDTIQEYAWDLDGDNDFNDAFGPQPDVTAYFTALGPGSYLVQLRVTDTTSTSFPSSGYDDLSDTHSAVVYVYSPDDPACSCVDNLAARAKLTKIQLTWTHVDGTHHYNVYRGTVSGGPYLFIGSTTSTYSTYLDYGPLTIGTTYYYVVRPAQLNGDEICQSNQASARPALR